jgi:hypothetical protein
VLHRIGTLRRACLDHLLITGPRHLAAVLREYVEHYDTHRPHRSLHQYAPAGHTPRAPARSSGHCGGTDSAASFMSMCRVHDVPEFSAPAGPERARAVRPVVVIYTVVSIVITVQFRASVDAQAGAYATGILAMMVSAAFAVTVSARRRRPRAVFGFGLVTP